MYGKQRKTRYQGYRKQRRFVKKWTRIIWGSDYKYAIPINYPFSKENECMHKNCKRICEERIIFSSEETILEVDVCTKHAIYYRNSSHVIFPYKLGYTPIKK